MPGKNQNKVILINGPGGTGKTTCARGLFESLGSCALLDVDSLTTVEPFIWGKELSILGLKNAAGVISNFFDHGFSQVIFSGGAFRQELCDALFSFLPEEIVFYYIWINAQKSVRHDRCISRARDGADTPEFLDFRDSLMPYTGKLNVPKGAYFEIDTSALDPAKVVQTVIDNIGAENLIFRTDNQ